jgi:hypothetical protein
MGRCAGRAAESRSGVSGSQYSDITDVQAWARRRMQKAPDFVIGADYLRRWWIVPRNKLCNVYLHEILHSDDDRALHDHPWDNTSMLLEGSYIEHTPEGSFDREAGSIIHRKATDAHRLEIPEGGRAISLFFTGPTIREWDFHCPQGWRHWRDFVDTRDSGQVGRGC